jgi:AcrR family transcriptional regulator
MTRSYRQVMRAGAQRRTHERIVDAAEAYYRATAIAPANFSAIAKGAGVQRLTLYRHFPDDAALLRAVLERWRARHALPTDRWSTIADPRQRLRVALESLYQYYAGAEPVLALLSSARDRNITVADWLDAVDRRLAAFRDQLAAGWGVTGRPQQWLGAMVGHALDSSTWRSLVKQGGLSSSDAARLMARSVAEIAREPYA